MVIHGRSVIDFSSTEFAATREFLSRIGIPAGSVDDRFEDQVSRAIRNNGWEPVVIRSVEPPGWTAEIRESRAATESRVAVAHDPYRVVALLHALRRALSWPTREEDRQAFESQTRSLLGLSAAEFMAKWRNDELSSDDPRVAYLLVTRPVGW
jgi:hypothetical protein